MTTTCALVFVMIGLAQAVSAVTPITACPHPHGFLISSPGQYRLDVDCLVAPNGVGIAIQASNVYLNLNGHTISGPGCPGGDPDAPSTFGILVQELDGHINNGTVKLLTTGIQVSGERNHLSHLTLRESCTGLQIVDANDNHANGNNISANVEGVALRNANHNVIDSNVINDNTGAPFGGGGGGLILYDNSDNNTITSNAFSRNQNFGVYVPTARGSNHNTIRGNIVKDTGAAGIDVRDNNNTIQSNRLSGNGVGIQLYFASENFVYRNRARGNTGFDFTDTDCQNNTWTNNIFTSDNEVGSGAGPGAGCIQ